MSSSTLKVGIVGLPNVGKSTLFNAIMGKQAALTAPYPFATIEPNVGVVDVPDKRLEKLRDAMFPVIESREQGAESREQNLMRPGLSRPPLVYSSIQFVDIAGLVKGAAEGNGLGNKFLSHIRDVDLILHVLRDFEADGVPRHQDSKDPVHDAEIVEMELELKDLEIMEREKKKKSLSLALDSSTEFIPPRAGLGMTLLSKKPVIYAVNVGEEKFSSVILSDPPAGGKPKDPASGASDLSRFARPLDSARGDGVLFFCAKLEEEIAQLSKIEQKEFMKVYGMETSGLDRIITECFHRLGLISFLTAPASAKAPAGQAGKWEIRAWPVRRGSTAPQAAGTIHSDFEKLFIRAEIIEWEGLVACGSWQVAKEKGMVRTEGRDYVIKDGEVCNFLIGK